MDEEYEAKGGRRERTFLCEHEIVQCTVVELIGRSIILFHVVL